MPLTPYGWTSTSSPGTSTYVNHTATLLNNGKILVAGGTGTAGTTTMLYDPTTDTWTTTSSSLSMVRGPDPVAVLLNSGKVLLIGGNATTGEIYDPDADTWTLTAPSSAPRLESSATLLTNGQVLVVGGMADAAARAAVIYDPVADTWTPAGSLRNRRMNHTATLLNNGKVLVAGGVGGGATSELYDPTTNTWTATSVPMSNARQSHTATLLNNGQVLVTGGTTTGGTVTGSCELYDPAADTWTVTGSMNTARVNHTAILVPNGNVLVVGGGNTGQETALIEVYLPGPYGAWGWTCYSSQNTATQLPQMSTPRTNHTATLISNTSKVLVVGGTGSSGTISAGNSAECALTAIRVKFYKQTSGYSIRCLVSCVVNGQYQYQNIPDSPYVQGYGWSLMVPASGTNMRVKCEVKALGLAQIWGTVVDTTFPTASEKTVTFSGTADSTSYNVTGTVQDG